SRELCGGTHVSATSEIGFVKIASETSVGANLRRIEAVTSFDALALMNRMEAELKETAEELRVPLFDVSERTAANVKQLKELQTKMKRNRETVADDGINALLEGAQTSAAGYPVVFGRMPEADAGQMRNLWDVLRARLGKPGAAVLATEKDGKPTLLAAGTPEAVEAGFCGRRHRLSRATSRARRWKAAMAQAGGKDARARRGPSGCATCCCRVVDCAGRGCGARQPELARNVRRTLGSCGIAAHPRHAPEAALPRRPACSGASTWGRPCRRFALNRRSPGNPLSF
ncbi:MAG: hypothetical protein ACLSVD_18405, partial [Eggerthellaceae bacterium]